MKEFNSIDSALEQYKQDLINNGEKIEDQRGDKVYTLPFYSIKFTNHIKNIGGMRIIEVPKSSPLNYESIKKYANQLLSGDIDDFVYTYGNRLIEYFEVNQYEVMENRIKEDINSRRAIAVTYDPKQDNNIEDIPCLIMLKITYFNNKLDLGVVFRSNDIKYAFSANLYALMGVHKYICENLNLKIGDLYYVCFDPHWKEI